MESPGSSFAYSYDLAGNRTGVSVNGTPTASYSYDAADQVVGWGYDAAGNLLSDGATSYSYDALNRLTGSSATGRDSSYAYNGDGTLVSQTTNGTTTSYAQDLAASQSQILAATTGITTTAYLYGSDIAPLLALTGSTRTWYGLDGQGSVRQTLDDAANVLGIQTYDPYGQVEAGSTLTSIFGYTGELQNTTTGAEYLRARWYQPGDAQLLGVDPALASTDQPYAYANDDPVNGSDPGGQCSTGTYILQGLEGSDQANCDHAIDAQLEAEADTAGLVKQDTRAVDTDINGLLNDLAASQDQAAIDAALNSPAGYGEYRILDPGQLTQAQQDQLGQTSLSELETFRANLTTTGAVEETSVSSPVKGVAGFFLGLCLGAVKSAVAHPTYLALGVLIVAGVIVIAILAYNRLQPRPQPTPSPTPPPTPEPPTPTPEPDYIYRGTNTPGKAQSVALRRLQDYATGLSFSTEPDSSRPNLKFRPTDLVAHGFLLRYDAGEPVSVLFPDLTPDYSPEGNFPPFHVTLYRSHDQWRDWKEAEDTAKNRPGGGVSARTQELYDLAIQ